MSGVPPELRKAVFQAYRRWRALRARVRRIQGETVDPETIASSDLPAPRTIPEFMNRHAESGAATNTGGRP